MRALVHDHKLNSPPTCCRRLDGRGSAHSPLPWNRTIHPQLPTQLKLRPTHPTNPNPNRTRLIRDPPNPEEEAFSLSFLLCWFFLLMAKKRQRQLGVTLHKNGTPSGVIESSNSDNDLHLKDSWVVVKKQRVKILIPPLPVANKSPPPNPGPVQLEPVARETVDSGSQFPVEACPNTASIHEQDKIKSLASKRVVQLTRKSPADCIPTFSKPIRRDLRMELRKPDQVATSKSHRTLGVSKTSKAMMQPRRLPHGPSIFLDQGMLLNQRLRALNLERKLQKAGGLSRWLASLGLGQFVRIFQRKGLSKFQLVNLTMKKLKDMGANAVGPRRKLMHAIDCFCQPCFY